MKLSELIDQLQRIADQGDSWKEAEVEVGGTPEENNRNSGPRSIEDVDMLDFGDHQIVLVTMEELKLS